MSHNPLATVSTYVHVLDRHIVEHRRGYRYGPENHALWDCVADASPLRILDLGAGCGILGLLAFERTQAHELIAVERQREFVELARENLADPRMRVIEEDIRHVVDIQADLVIANPPFYSPDEGQPSRNTTKRNATHANFGDVFTFCEVAARNMTIDGTLWVLYPSDRLDRLHEAVRDAGLCTQTIRIQYARNTGRPYRVWLEAKREAAPLRVFSATTLTSR